jgi:hypothetical protein
MQQSVWKRQMCGVTLTGPKRNAVDAATASALHRAFRR